MILEFIGKIVCFIGKIIGCIIRRIIAIPLILYTIFLEARAAATKHPDRLKLPLGMNWEIRDIYFDTHCICSLLFWGDGKIAKIFQKIRIMRGEELPLSPEEQKKQYWESSRQYYIDVAKQLYEEYNIGDGRSTTVKEIMIKDEQKKILGQIINLTKKDDYDTKK